MYRTKASTTATLIPSRAAVMRQIPQQARATVSLIFGMHGYARNSDPVKPFFFSSSPASWSHSVSTSQNASCLVNQPHNASPTNQQICESTPFLRPTVRVLLTLPSRDTKKKKRSKKKKREKSNATEAGAVNRVQQSPALSLQPKSRRLDVRQKTEKPHFTFFRFSYSVLRTKYYTLYGFRES